MIRINLLGDAVLQAGAKKPEKAEVAQVYAAGEGAGRMSVPVAGIVVGLVFASFGGIYWLMLQREVAKAEAKKVELERTKAELDKYIKLEQEFRRRKEALQKKKEVMLGLRRAQHQPVHFMEEIANALPDDVWFKEISQKGTAVTVQGESASFEAINAFRAKLVEQNKWFQNVNYPTANKKGSTVEFTISFDLKNP
jgi:Tfp pilus assembly protein PilN